jgi:WD40 repeat protein
MMPRPERALDPGGGPVEQFAADLRDLRESAGRPGYRELARRAHFSVTTLSVAASGRQLPSLEVTLAFVEACGGDQEAWAQRWKAVAAELTSDNDLEAEAPYRGLAAYEPDDADWFFGRTRLVDEVAARLLTRPVLAVFGASGSGKSSVLRAGVLPRFTARGWTVALLTPGDDPGAALAGALASLTGPDNLLVVDQFEELFTLCDDPGVRGAFVASLLEATREPGRRVRVLLGIRADFYARCADFPELVTNLRDAQTLIGGMSPAELREALVRPAERAGLSVEGTLVSTVVAELTGRPGALPLASHAMAQAWRRRRGNAVTLAGYLVSGGVDGAVAQSAEAVYSAFDQRRQETIRRVLLRLVDVGDDSLITRRRVRCGEFGDDPDVQAVVDALVAARLLTVATNTVEITHEALVQAWPRLRGWVDDDREGLRLHRLLTRAAAEWQSVDHDPGALLRGARLSRAADWWAEHPDAVTAAERDFLQRSIGGDRRHRAGRRRRRRAVVAGLLAALLTTGALAVVARTQASRATGQRDLAVARYLIASSRSQLDIDPQLALLLARRAYDLRPGPETEASLRQATLQSRIVRVLPGAVDGSGLSAAGIAQVAISPDGRSIATADSTDTVRVWSLEAGAPPRVFAGAGQHVAFSPDGRRLAAVANGQAVQSPVRLTVLDPTGRQQPTVTTGPVGRAAVIAFGPAGPRVAVAGADSTEVWDPARPGRVRLRLPCQTEVGNDMVFSGDARQLVCVNRNETVALWDVGGSGAPAERRHWTMSDPVSVALSPDGRRLATADVSGHITVRPVAGSRAPTELTGHQDAVWSMAFNADGTRLVTASADNTARIWETDGPGQALVLRGHTDVVRTAVFRPDGGAVATGGDDGSVRLWDAGGAADPALLLAPGGSGPAPKVSTNGRYLVAGLDSGGVRMQPAERGARATLLPGGRSVRAEVSDDGRWATASRPGNSGGRAWIWRVPGGPVRPPQCPPGPPGLHFRPSVTDVVTSTDGILAAVACTDGHIVLWSTTGSAPPRLLQSAGWPLRFGPDGRFLAATWGDDVAVWTAPFRDPPRLLTGHTAELTDLRFSADGTRIASAGRDGTIRIWNLTGDPAPPLVLSGHSGTVESVAFSPDGRRLASVGGDGTLRVWDAASGAGLVVFPPFGPALSSVTFAPDGRRLVTTYADLSARVWPCEVCGSITDLLSLSDRRTVRPLSPDEKHLFLSGTG